MWHLFKYRFIQTIRQTSSMFWALVFPIILGSLFYFSFANAGLAATGESEWDLIPAAVIVEDGTTENARTFSQFLDKLDGESLEIKNYSTEQDAVQALEEEEVLGIYYVNETPSLLLGKNGLNESILTALLNNYNQNVSLIQQVITEHPEKLPDAIEAMNDYRTTIQEVSLGGTTLNPNVQYFFALIAFACLSGAYLGVHATFDSQANLTPLGARRSITPTHKLKLIMIDLLVLILIHFFDILILNVFVIKVLGITLGSDIPSLLLVDFMGSLIGVCLGLALGSLNKLSLNIKMGFATAFTLLLGFLSGLMFGNMKNIIELHCPVLNRLNPAAVLSDAFYCMGVYNDTAKFGRCILILAVMSILLFVIAFLGVRRERYDSI